MTTNKKGRAGGHQATLTNSPGANLDARSAPVGGAPGKVRINTSESTCNSTGTASRVKAAIVTLALWGWFPLGLADRINRMGGPHND